MIKYFEFDSFDEGGQHIIPVNNDRQLVKTASSYSPELAKVIANLKRQPDRYYVVINALGSYEYWGCNRNGDAFPEEALKHASLRTDMGSDNDYGYKTFEYYAHFYKHHVNKDPKKSFGEVIFSYWNPQLHRVELIVAMDVSKNGETIARIEAGEPVSCSMGCRVPHDFCSVCENKARTRDQYCNHLKNYMRQIVDKDLARKWSMETGRNIIPGMQVFAWNRRPKFFDISEVYIGADRTSYFLGKAASVGHFIKAADLADAYGMNDAEFDKIASVNKIAVVKKNADIDKEIGGNLGPTDIDGTVDKIDMASILDKATVGRVNQAIRVEPDMPKDFLNNMATSTPIETIVSTLLGLGIQPKPREFQRIVLVRVGARDLADQLDNNDVLFSDIDGASNVAPAHVGLNSFSDALGRMLLPYLASRSAFPSFLCPRVNALEKMSSDDSAVFQPLAQSTKPLIVREAPLVATLSGIAALYAGLKMKAMGLNPQQLAQMFIGKPWLRNLVGGGVLYSLYNQISSAPQSENQTLLMPAGAYANALQNTHFSGHMKISALNAGKVLGNAIIGGAIGLPMSYIANSYNMSQANKGRRPLIDRIISPTAGIVTGAVVGGAGTMISDEVIARAGHALAKIKR